MPLPIIAAGVAAGKVVLSALPVIGELVGKVLGIVDKVVPDKDLREKLKAEIEIATAALRHEREMKELELEGQENTSRKEVMLAELGGNWFNSGWRPALGWVGAISLGIYYIPQFLMATIIWTKFAWSSTMAASGGKSLFDVGNAVGIPPYPISDIKGLMELVLLLLGYGGMRTFEKLKGLSK
jgi:hypothetical protein